VLVNIAMTADGKIDTVEREGARISSPEDKAAVDRLRAEVDAIMVGGATFLAEDPRLTVRDGALVRARRDRGLPDQPRKASAVSVLPDSPRPDSRFIHDGGGSATVSSTLFTTPRTSAAALAAWREAGAEVVVTGRERVDLAAALDHLASLGVTRLLVEGGGTFIAAMFDAGLVDEFRQYIAPFVVGGHSSPTPLDGPGVALHGRVDLELLTIERLGPGIALRYRVVPGQTV